MNAPDTKAPLEYDRSGNAPTRRQFRMLLVLTAVNTLFMGWFVVGPQTSQIFRSQWSQWQAHRAEKARMKQVLDAQQNCLEHTFPADLVLYEEDPAEAKRLITERADYKPLAETGRPAPYNWPSIAYLDKLPAEWTALNVATNQSFNNLYANALVFIGERRTPSGERRLLTIHLSAQPNENESSTGNSFIVSSEPMRVLSASVAGLSPHGEALESSGQARLQIQSTESRAVMDGGGWRFVRSVPLRLLAGQADPADPTHVVIPYQLAGQPGAIDLYLLEDGPIFKPRSGVVTVSGGTPQVMLPPPTTKPS